MNRVLTLLLALLAADKKLPRSADAQSTATNGARAFGADAAGGIAGSLAGVAAGLAISRPD